MFKVKKIYIIFFIFLLLINFSSDQAYANDNNFLNEKPTKESEKLMEDLKVAVITSGEKLVEGFKIMYKFIKNNNIIEKSVYYTKNAFNFLKTEIEAIQKGRKKTPTALNTVGVFN